MIATFTGEDLAALEGALSDAIDYRLDGDDCVDCARGPRCEDHERDDTLAEQYTGLLDRVRAAMR